MEKILANIKRVQEEDFSRMKAGDSHELLKALEVRSMLLISEALLRAKLFREESRGAHKREDFSLTDNINWLKWVVVEKKDEKMHLYTEAIPTPYIKPPIAIYPVNHPSLGAA